MRARPLLFCLALVLAAGAARAARAADPWSIYTASPPETLAPELVYWRHTLERPFPDRPPERVTLHLLRFPSSRYALKVVDQGDEKPGRYRNLAEAMVKTGCLAGCNGGFFHPDFRPSGLVVAGGVRFNRFENAKLLSGLLMVDGKGPRLLRRAEFEDHPGIEQLLQAGPYLVDGGRTVAGLSNEKERTRTFVATDGRGQWAIGLCTSVNLADLGIILANPALIGGLEIERALNLDGGSSSALYFARESGPAHHHRSFTSVRNYLGIAPK